MPYPTTDEAGNPVLPRAVYGWTGSAYERLKSDGQGNLFAAIREGTAQASVTDAHASEFSDKKALITLGGIMGRWSGSMMRSVGIGYIDSDNPPLTSICLNSRGFLFGFNGTNWNRLRTYGTGVLKVARAEAGLSTLLRTTAGQIKAGAGKLYWLVVTGNGGNGVIELSDDTDGSTTAKIVVRVPQSDCKPVVLDPPMEFGNGIYLKSVANSEVTAGYM